MEWNMTFDRKGKLLKATHAPAYVTRDGARVRSADLSNGPTAEKQP
jgi:hypothetical protein